MLLPLTLAFATLAAPPVPPAQQDSSRLEIRVGDRRLLLSVRDTVQLAVGDTVHIVPRLYDTAGRPRPASGLWWHDTTSGVLSFENPLAGGRYSADPGRIVAQHAGITDAMLHWEGVAGGAYFIFFRIEPARD